MYFYRFSFIAPCLLENGNVPKKIENPIMSIRTNERNIFDDYVLTDLLGSGSYSQVRLAKHKATGQQYAIKVRFIRSKGNLKLFGYAYTCIKKQSRLNK